MSYYKYQGPETQINWAKVGKDMSDMLGTEQAEREEKREQIDTQVREDQKWISDNTTYGDLSSKNTQTAQLANDLSEFNRLQYSLLKKGRLSLQDYTRNRQNVMDSAEIEFGLDKMLQDRAGVALGRMDEAASDGLPIASGREQWNVKQAEKLLKTKNARTIINDDGTFRKVIMVKNPETGMFEVSKNPNDVLSAAELATLMASTHDRFKMGEVVNKLTSQLGAFEKSELKDAISAGGIGQILTTTDSKEASAYKKWEEDQIGIIMSNPENVASILYDMKLTTPNEEDYDFTYNKEAFNKDKTGSLIFINRDESSRGVPEFKPEQEEIVKDTLRTAMRASIDEKHKVTAISRKPYPPTGPAPKTPPIEYNKFEEVFMSDEGYGQYIKDANGKIVSDEKSIEKALYSLPGLDDFSYRVEDGKHELYGEYDGESGGEFTLIAAENGAEFAELMLLQSLEYSIGSDGIYNTEGKQKAYAGKKQSNSGGGKKKRTIKQIQEEDGVTIKEAIKIFNNQ